MTRWISICSLIAWLGMSSACSSSSNNDSNANGAGDGDGNDRDGAVGPDDFGNAGVHGGAGSAASTGGSAGAGVGASAGTSAPAECLGETQSAEPVEVDMFVMLDRSSSMLGETGAGSTKWDAIRSALTAFARDPDSAGLGVGLQYFPIGREGVPAVCATDDECAAASGGECMNRACVPPVLGPPVDFTFCRDDLDCSPLSDGCVPFGICSLDEGFACFDISAGGCGAEGDCVAATGECSQFASCDAADYASPDVPIATLPGNAESSSIRSWPRPPRA